MPISDPTDDRVDVEISARVAEVRQRIAVATKRGGHEQSVTLVAVTKNQDLGAVRAVVRAGVDDIGENRVQEAERKMAAFTEPVRWHLIGHLQRNKVNAATKFSVVHGVDSARLAEALQEAAKRAGVTLDVLAQVNVSGEVTKSGLSGSSVTAFGEHLRNFPNLRLMGVMTMAPLDAPEGVLRAVFGGARAVRSQLQQLGHPAPWLSMGMSGDFEVAVEEGATHVRLGTVLFGSRT